jgi:hypothetical protein
MEANKSNYSVELASWANISINYIDYGVRVLGLLIHVVYFLVVFKIAEFQKRSFLYLHQVNLIGLLYCLVYTAFINSRNPNFANEWVNNFLCTWCELLWAVLKFMRIFSILQLTIYRYLAIFKIASYKSLNQSKLWTYGLFAFSWTLSIVITLALKFSLQTNYSLWYCIDGNSEILIHSVIYYVGVVCITVSVIVCNYILGYKMKRQLNGKKRESLLKATKTNLKFVQNLFILNFLMLTASINSLVIDFEVVILEEEVFWYLDNMLEIARPVLRIIFIVNISFIPISSLFIDHKRRIYSHLQLAFPFLLNKQSKINPIKEDAPLYLIATTKLS